MTPAARSGTSIRGGAALAVVLVVAAAVRLYDLGAQSTWADELYRIVWSKGYEIDRWFGVLPSETGARLPPRDLSQALRVVNAHNPPLYGTLLNTWMRAVGSESDLAARLPSALLGVLSVLATFLAARQLLSPRVGLWAAALVALSPFHVFYAQEVNHYTLVGALVALSLFFHLRWLERPSLASGAGLALTGLGALYAHYYAAIALAFQGLELLVRHRREPRRLVVAALPYLAVAAGFAPYLPTLLRQLREMTDPAMLGTFQGWRYFAERVQAIGVAPWLGERGEYLAPLAGVPIASLTAALFVAGLGAIHDRSARRVLLLCGVGPLATVAILYWATETNSILWPRYQLVFTFAQLIPIAAALDASRRARWLAAPALAVLAAIGLRYHFVDLVKEDWKGAVAAIASRGSAQEPIVVFRPNLAYALARYLPTENRLFGVGGGEGLPRLVAAISDGREATWFVSAWATTPEVPQEVHRLLACRYARREDFPVPAGRVGLTVSRYSGPSAAATAVVSRAEAPAACPPPEATGAMPWERAAEGPIFEGATIEAPSPGEAVPLPGAVTITGWAFSTRGIRSLAFEVDGREVVRARHLGMERPDVAAAFPAAPATHAGNAGFWAVLDVGAAPPGVRSLTVIAVHEDGTTRTIAAREVLVTAPRPPSRPR